MHRNIVTCATAIILAGLCAGSAGSEPSAFASPH